MKAIKTQYGYIVKRKARINHFCKNCYSQIFKGDEYYQITNDCSNNMLRNDNPFYVSSAICEKCWNGIKLEA